MIYTSYYAKMKKFPDRYYPVSISLGAPQWYTGAVFKNLAPTWDILSNWKINHEKDAGYWEAWYNEQYAKQVLEKVSPFDVVLKLQSLLPEEVLKEIELTGVPVWKNQDIHIVLLCYEKAEDFCHRKLVAKWFETAGIPCREVNNSDLEKEPEDIERT